MPKCSVCVQKKRASFFFEKRQKENTFGYILINQTELPKHEAQGYNTYSLIKPVACNDGLPGAATVWPLSRAEHRRRFAGKKAPTVRYSAVHGSTAALRREKRRRQTV